jgi:hypothetical protein
MRALVLFAVLTLASSALAQEAQEEVTEQPRPRPRPRPAPQAEQRAEPQPAPAPAEAPAQAVPAGQPRYLETMRQELAAMRVRDPECAVDDALRGHCSYRARGMSTGRDLTIQLQYSDNTDTIYVFVERYLVAPADGQTTPAVLRRLMELNWTLLVGSFEWSATDGEVRLKMVINTDSNFDRRAFRSVLRSIVQVADRYWGELDRLQRGQGSAAP